MIRPVSLAVGSRRLAGALLIAALAVSGGSAAQATIYRCHALDGQLLFQDKPCDQVAGTLEARKGSAGEIIPNAPPAPAVEGPDLTERYEHYLDAQAERRAKEAAARPAAPADPAPAAAARSASSGRDGAEPYAGYSEGYYPYPVYPYPVYPNPGQNPRPVRQTPQAPIYGPGGQLPLPSILPAPGLSFSPPPSRPLAPGNVVGRDPNH